MANVRISISLDEQTLAEIDRLVADGVFPSRRKAIEDSIQERAARLHRSRLARECVKLVRNEEQALAEISYVSEGEWPEY